MNADSDQTDGTMLLIAAPHEEPMDGALAERAREEKIRIRAYEIYLDRGSRDGSDVDDWLQAEIECLGS